MCWLTGGDGCAKLPGGDGCVGHGVNQLLFFILFLHIHIVSSSEIIKIIKGPVLRELFNVFLLHMIALSFLSHLLEHNLKNSQTFSKE